MARRKPWKALLLAPLVALVATIVFAPGAMAQTRKYCTYSLSTSASMCFSSEHELRDHRATSAEIDLVAVYNWINYDQRGGYLIFTGDHNCTAAYDDDGYNVPRLDYIYYAVTGITLNNTMSSVSTYYAPKCDIKLWDGAGYTGSYSVWIDRCTHLGTCTAANWYDRASSFKLS